MCFFLMSQGSFNPKIRFLGQKLCPVARMQTDGQTHTKVTNVGTLSGFQEFFLQPIIQDRPNIASKYFPRENKVCVNIIKHIIHRQTNTG